MRAVDITHRGIAVSVLMGGIILLTVMPEFLVPLLPLAILAGCELFVSKERAEHRDKASGRDGRAKS